MIILPAIDLRNKKCVRLYQGDYSKSMVVEESPIKAAMSFENEGAKFIHMVDLDGALSGNVDNIGAILDVVKNINIPIELGGGIRNIKTIDSLIENGIGRVILGTSALNSPELVKEAVKKYKEKIAVGIDARNEYVAVNGWTKLSEIHYIDFAKQMESIGVKTIIYTDISRDGTLTGPNLEQLSLISKSVTCNIIASGGVKNIDDVKAINKMNLYGVIIGKAIYSRNIKLKEAIEVCSQKG